MSDAPDNWRSVGAAAAEIAADVVFRQKVRRLCARGDRLVVELLAEIGAARLLRTYVEQLIDRYLDTPDEHFDATGGRHIPRAPLHSVQL